MKREKGVEINRENWKKLGWKGTGIGWSCGISRNERIGEKRGRDGKERKEGK